MQKLLLNHTQITQKITRIAYQIYEDHHTEPIIMLAGIKKSGFVLAGLLAAELRKISPIEIILTDIRIKKTNPTADKITTGVDINTYAHLPFVLVDDVANTGKTLMYALMPLLPHTIKSIKIAVLVQRSHRLYPVSPDYAGLMLATTLHDTVRINFDDNGQIQAYLQ
jgi:pyrimidine operon attenuation protein/uracil phosphoribosyltransferase